MGVFSSPTVNTSSPRVSSFLVTTSSYGSPIKLIFGTTMIAPVLLDYIDFTAIAHTTTTSSGGKGGSVKVSNTSYTYTVAILLGLGEGTLTGVGQILEGSKTTDASSLGLTFFNGALGGSGHFVYTTHYMLTDPIGSPPYSLTMPTGTVSVSSVIYHDPSQYLLGNSSFGNAIYSYNVITNVLTINVSYQAVVFITYQTATYVTDTAGQLPWGYMLTKHPDRALTYSGTSYLAGVLDLGDSALLPNFNIECYGLCQSQQGTPSTTKVEQFAYIKTIEISNWSSNSYVEEYQPDGGWITLNSRYYDIDQKEDSYGNKISGVYVYTFNFDDRTDGYDRADPFYLRIHYTATTASVSYTATDANPADIIYALLTSTVYGENFPAQLIGNLSDYKTFCNTNSLLLSPAYDTSTECQSIIKDLTEQTNSEYVFSQGKVNIVPYYDNLDSIYDITQDDIQDQKDDSLIITRTDQSDTYNIIPVEFYDRNNQYNTDVVYATDEGDKDLHGIRQASTKSYHGITSRALAQTVAQTILQQQLYKRSTYVVKLPQAYILLDPMDAVSLSCEIAGLDVTTVRVVSIKEDAKDYSLEFTFEDNLYGVASVVEYETQDVDRSQINLEESPGNINYPVIFEAPNTLEVWFYASGGPQWGGANVWISEDGTHYKKIGTINGKARQGTLASSLPIGTDPDTVNTPTIDLTMSQGALTSGTLTDADNYNTLCYVDGEFISYETATLTGTDTYQLSYLRRGVYNSTIAAHNAGGQFVRVDDAVLKYPFTTDDIGKTVYIKFTSINVFGGGEQELADVTAYTHTIKLRPVPNVSNIGIAENTYILKDGTALTDLTVTFDGVDAAVLDHYNIYYNENDTGYKYYGVSSNDTCIVKALKQAQTVIIRITVVDKFGIESAGTASSAYTIVGKSDPPPDVTNLTVEQYQYNRAQAVLSWDAISDEDAPDLKGYEIRSGASWDAGTKINDAVITDNDYTYTIPTDGHYTFWIKAIDNSGNYSTSAISAAIQVTLEPDAVTNLAIVQSTQDKSKATLSWSAPTGSDIAYYVVKYGDVWSSGTLVAQTKEITLTTALPGNGTWHYMVQAVTVAGYVSAITSVDITASVQPLDVTGFTATQDTTDKTRVVLTWNAPQEPDVSYYIIKDGTSWDTAKTISPRVSTTLYDVELTDELPHTWLIKAVTIAGNESQYAASVEGNYDLRPSVVPSLQATQDSNNRSVLNIQWGEVDDGDLSGYQVKIGYDWNSGESLPFTRELYSTYTLTASGNYKVMIKAVNNAGYYSDELSISVNVQVEPSDVTGLMAFQNGDTVELYWDKSADADVTGYEVHEGYSYDQGSLVATGITNANYTVDIDSTRTYRYFVKAINSSGFYSINAVSASVTVSSISAKNVIETYDEIALASGTHSNTSFGASSLNFQTLGGKFSDYPTTKFSDVGGSSVLKINKRNLSTNSFMVYNNYNNNGMTATLTALDETYDGQTIYRLTMTATTATVLMSLQGEHGNHGICLGHYSFLANTKYIDSIYWRYSGKACTVSGTPSSIRGWDDISTIDIDSTWHRTISSYSSTAVQSDYKFWGVQCPTAVLNEAVSIDFVCDQLEIGDAATAYGSYYSSGSYLSAVIDVDSVITANVTTLFTSSVALKGGLAALYIRTSQDNTTWLDWEVFKPIQRTFRYVQFRVDLATTDTTKTPEVNQFMVSIDVPDTDIRKTVSLSAAINTISYGHTFYTNPSIIGTVIGSGLQFELLSVDKAQCTGQIVDKTNNDAVVAGSVCLQIGGY